MVLDRNNQILLSQVQLVNPTTLANLGTVSYQYDADELLTRASSGTTRLDLRYRSDVALLAELQTYSQNVQRMTDRWTHDGFAELSRHEVRDGASPTGALRFSQDYQRDKLGRITRRTETLG
jgi:hypothetical protein